MQNHLAVWARPSSRVYCGFQEVAACSGGWVTNETHDLRTGGSHSARVESHLDLGIHDRRDELDEIADRDLTTRTTVERLADNAVVGLQQRDICVDGVEHEVEVARRVECSEEDLALAGGDLRDRRRNDGSSGLAGPIGVERSERDHRKVEAEVVALDELVGGDLRCRVRRLSL